MFRREIVAKSNKSEHLFVLHWLVYGRLTFRSTVRAASNSPADRGNFHDFIHHAELTDFMGIVAPKRQEEWLRIWSF